MFEFLLLVVGVSTTTLVALVVLLRDTRGSAAKLFAALAFGMIGWSITTYLSLHAASDEATLALIRWIMFFVVMQNTAFFLLVPVFPDSDKKILDEKKNWFIIPFSALVAIIALTPFLFSSFEDGAPQPGPGIVLFLLHAIFVGAASLVRLFRRLKRAKGIKKAQLGFFFIGTLSMFTLEPLCNFILPVLFKSNFLVSFSPLYIVVFSGLIGYAMVRKGLFDIKLAVVRSVVYILSLLALAALYYVAAYFISITVFRERVITEFDVSPLSIFLALILAFVFQPVKQFFDQVTDRIFYRNRYDTNEFLIRLGRILTSTTELRMMLEKVDREIRKTLKADSSLFVVYRDHHPNELVGEGISKRFSSEELVQLDGIAVSSPGSLLVVERLRSSDLESEQAVYEILVKKHVALVLPLISADETIGYFMLGEHKVGGYTQQDTSALEAIANELVIAVQNARSIQALRDLNVNLEKRIEDATQELRKSNEQLRQADETKDEFVSMASHQLRTPLTSIKGYISMVLEGDAGKITPMQRKLLEEAFISSERMVHLIGDFLNVSRLQTGKFVLDKSLVNLADLIEEEVDSLKETAKARSLKLQYRKPSRIPSLYIDGGKIHQVIMNFIDNAIYYSAEHTVITMRLVVEGGEVVFEVRDTGIGVPKSEQVRLFTKFFRATNARKQRPDGTGIGLFLAKKVIDAHGGSMVFESVEGEGSTFGFRLPVKKLSEPPRGRESE